MTILPKKPTYTNDPHNVHERNTVGTPTIRDSPSCSDNCVRFVSHCPIANIPRIASVHVSIRCEYARDMPYALLERGHTISLIRQRHQSVEAQAIVSKRAQIHDSITRALLQRRQAFQVQHSGTYLQTSQLAAREQSPHTDEGSERSGRLAVVPTLSRPAPCLAR